MIIYLKHRNHFETERKIKETAAAIRYGEIRSDTALRAEQGYFSANALIRAEGAGALPNGRFAPVGIKTSAAIKMTIPVGMVIFMVAATDLIEYAKTHLPILLGTQVTVSRKQLPRPVHRIH